MPPRGRPLLVVLSLVASSSVASLSSASFCDAAAACRPAASPPRRARKRRPMSEEEDEVQDQKQTIDAKCKATLACATMLVEYEACQARIEAKGSGSCEGQYGDWVHCVDACAAKSLFSKLK